MKNSSGRINSIETFGLLDGPGIRVVIFLQGCNLRCLYCHNPETWNIDNNEINLTPQELLELILRYKPYFKDNGGVTFSGGEPLLQNEFLLESIKLLKENNIHTCIDTAGFADNYENIVDLVDLIILDIKSYESNQYKEITGKDISKSLEFLKYCQIKNKKIWLRTVIVPGINDNIDFINGLAEFIKPLKNILKIELLPYQTLGVSKYRKLNISYRLDNVKAMNIDKCNELEKILLDKLAK